MFNRCYDRQNDINNTFMAEDMNIDMDFKMNNTNMPIDINQGTMMPGTISQPIIEPMQEEIVNRTIIHEVPHICPKQTRIINHHVFKHTYQPAYSCCEENVCSEIQCGSCCNFR